MGLNLLLWIAGVVLIAVAWVQLRVPYSRYRALQASDENSRRYDDWRGGRRRATDGGAVTGADLMRAMLRRKLQLWALVGVAGFVLVFLGFLLR
jgi:hypothetical protein